MEVVPKEILALSSPFNSFVCADLTSSNILFRISEIVHQWSDNDVYQNLGSPEMENIRVGDGHRAGPLKVVAPIDVSLFSSPSLLQEDVLLVDFGQSFLADSPSPNYEPATPLHYLSPEAFFDSKIGLASDVWALACLIFEIRAGWQLFDSFFNSDALVLKRMVETMGRFPDPWWGSWQDRHPWFDETGEVKPEEEQRKQGVLLIAAKSTLRQKLCEIGQRDDAPEVDEGSMIEKTGTRLEEVEIVLLADLLAKMLKYDPEDRITVAEVLRHPWFAYN